MGGRTESIHKCPECGKVIKSLFVDKRDWKLKCEECYKKPVVKK